MASSPGASPRIRVMVVDDSVVSRRLLSDAIAAVPDLEVVGTASSGRLALTKLDMLAPDILTLDVEMPDLDGLETLREIKKRRPDLPVLMCSSVTERGAAVTLDALSLGAADYVTKPTASAPGGLTAFGASLVAKLRALANRRGAPGRPGAHAPASAASAAAPAPAAAAHASRPAAAAAPARPRPAAAGGNAIIRAVAIGVSTGGPNALAALLPQLPADLPVPLLIVQHMPPLFTRLLAERLDRLAAFPVVEAQADQPLVAGHAYLAPGDFHLVVRPAAEPPAAAGPAGPFKLALASTPPENWCRPAVDVLFRSVTDAFGAGTLGVVLTGMGQDGLRGCERIRQAGGHVIVQDEATSVVWGMPGFVAQAGLADEVLPLSEIAAAIVRRLRSSRAPGAHDPSPAKEMSTCAR